MAYNPVMVPQPTGKVSVATPGVPVPIVNTLLTTANPGGGFVLGALTDDVPCNKININAPSGNTGLLYLGQADMIRATMAGVIGTIPPGGSFSLTTNISLNSYHAQKFCLDADNAADFGFGSIDQV